MIDGEVMDPHDPNWQQPVVVPARETPSAP